jgi:hypothetical protein
VWGRVPACSQRRAAAFTVVASLPLVLAGRLVRRQRKESKVDFQIDVLTSPLTATCGRLHRRDMPIAVPA